MKDCCCSPMSFFVEIVRSVAHEAMTQLIFGASFLVNGLLVCASVPSNGVVKSVSMYALMDRIALIADLNRTNTLSAFADRSSLSRIPIMMGHAVIFTGVV